MILDSETNSQLNNSEIGKLLTVKGANKQKYQIITFNKVKTVPYDSLFSFYMESSLRYTDVRVVETKLAQLWTDKGKLLSRALAWTRNSCQNYILVYVHVSIQRSILICLDCNLYIYR